MQVTTRAAIGMLGELTGLSPEPARQLLVAGFAGSHPFPH
jgi:hypothetical protein